MPVFEAKAGLHHRARIRHVIDVGVAHEKEMRCLAHVHAIVGHEQTGREGESVCEHSHLVGAAVVVRVFENLDPVAALLTRLGAERILV